MKKNNLYTYNLIKNTLKFPHEVCFIISKFVGKISNNHSKIRWIRLKYPNEKRLVRIYY